MSPVAVEAPQKATKSTTPPSTLPETMRAIVAYAPGRLPLEEYKKDSNDEERRKVSQDSF